MRTLKLLVPVAAILPLVVGCERKTPTEEAREERIEAREEVREERQELMDERRELESDLREDLAELDRRWERFENRTQAAGYKAEKEAADEIAEAKRNYQKARGDISQAMNRIGTASAAQWSELKSDVKGALNRADDALDNLESDVGEASPASPASPRTPSMKGTPGTPSTPIIKGEREKDPY